MKRLLSIEFLKLRSYKIFWILLGLYFVMMILAMLGFSGYVENIFENSPFSAAVGGVASINHFPLVWNYMTYLAGFFHLIIGVMIIILTCNEYGYKTVRQNVINGLSRWEFLLSKFLMIGMLCIASTFVVGAVALILGFMYSDAGEVGMLFDKVAFIPGYFLQMLGYSLLAFLIGLLVRRTGFAIGFLMLYVLAFEKIAVYYLPEPLSDFMPVEAMDNMIVFPLANFIDVEVPPIPPLRETLLCVFYSLGFGGLSYYILWRRDL